MMKQAHIIGSSADTIAVIVDLLYEVRGIKEFLTYKNIDIDISPNFTLMRHKYEIVDLGLFPPSNSEVFFGLSGPFNKKEVYGYFTGKNSPANYLFGSIIYPNSYVSVSSYLDAGILIEPSVIISSQSIIGFGVSIKRGVSIGHHNRIGSFSDINPSVVISGKVSIGSGCIIGSGSVIIDNVSIGDNTIIGVGSVVTKNIPSGVIAFGNPCKVMRENDKWDFS